MTQFERQELYLTLLNLGLFLFLNVFN